MLNPAPAMRPFQALRDHRVLVTGGAGFIGSNLVRHLLAHTAAECVCVVDALTYAGHMDNLRDVPSDRFRFIHGDIIDAALMEAIFVDHRISMVIHLAAESHVDRSIDDPLCFISTNVMGTAVLLHVARKLWKGREKVRFHHVSTDEVFGSLGTTGLFDEGTAYDPSSPYSASKAASDHLVRAWHRTYGLPVTVSNCSNNYGPYQHPEKLIPHMVTSAVAMAPLPVYGKGLNVRDWLHVEDHCRAIVEIVERGTVGQTYCVGGDAECRNIDVVEAICDILHDLRPVDGGYRHLITHVTDRPGHDQRYAIDATRIRDELGWSPQHTFRDGLRATIAWYLEHGDWIAARRQHGWAGARQGLTQGEKS